MSGAQSAMNLNPLALRKELALCETSPSKEEREEKYLLIAAYALVGIYEELNVLNERLLSNATSDEYAFVVRGVRP
jgi:hypothetical protein